MRCALVFYFAVTIFVVVYGLPDLCVYKDYEEKSALCGRHDVEYTFDFIPPISQNITYIDLLEQPLKQLPHNAFRNVSSQRSISRIRLADCQISHVHAGALLYLHNLTNIDLSHNDIKQIDSKLFIHTKHIKFIYLEYNNIEVVSNGLFQDLPLLELIYLDHNQIYQIEWFSFKNTPSLRIIHLNNNQIEFMNILFKDKFDNLTTLSLYGNPWKCDCELGPLYEFHIKINQLNQHELVCEKPPTLQGRNWSDISRDKFVCRAENTISAKEHDDNIPLIVHNVAISTRNSVMTSVESMTSGDQDDNIPVTVYNVAISTRDSIMTSVESMTSGDQDDNIPVTVYNVAISTRDSVMTSVESMTSGDQDDNIPVTVYNVAISTRDSVMTSSVLMTSTEHDDKIYTGLPQPPVMLNWIQYSILSLVLVGVIAVVIGVVFVVRHTLTKSHRRRHVQLPTMIKRRSFRRTNARQYNAQSSAVSGDSDSGSSTDNLDEDLTSIHHYEIREATIN